MKKKLAVYICCLAMVCALFSVQSPVFGQDVSGGENTQQNAGSEEITSTDKVLSNGLFSVTMPDDLQGLYVGVFEDNTIIICDKKSREEKAGGQVYEISAERSSMDYTRDPALKKYGELTSGDGTVYDMTLSHPTDVRYTPVNGGKPESYKKIEEKAQEIMDSIASTDGGSYSAGAGMKGEELYQAGKDAFLAEDYGKALEYFQLAADAGQIEACGVVGALYEAGVGAEQDYGKALEWYQKAAEQGSPMALNNLGDFYEYGKGVEQRCSRLELGKPVRVFSSRTGWRVDGYRYGR